MGHHQSRIVPLNTPKILDRDYNQSLYYQNQNIPIPPQNAANVTSTHNISTAVPVQQNDVSSLNNVANIPIDTTNPKNYAQLLNTERMQLENEYRSLVASLQSEIEQSGSYFKIASSIKKLMEIKPSEIVNLYDPFHLLAKIIEVISINATTNIPAIYKICIVKVSLGFAAAVAYRYHVNHDLKLNEPLLIVLKSQINNVFTTIDNDPAFSFIQSYYLKCLQNLLLSISDEHQFNWKAFGKNVLFSVAGFFNVASTMTNEIIEDFVKECLSWIKKRQTLKWVEPWLGLESLKPYACQPNILAQIQESLYFTTINQYNIFSGWHLVYAHIETLYSVLLETDDPVLRKNALLGDKQKKLPGILSGACFNGYLDLAALVPDIFQIIEAIYPWQVRAQIIIISNIIKFYNFYPDDRIKTNLANPPILKYAAETYLKAAAHFETHPRNRLLLEGLADTLVYNYFYILQGWTDDKVQIQKFMIDLAKNYGSKYSHVPSIGEDMLFIEKHYCDLEITWDHSLLPIKKMLPIKNEEDLKRYDSDTNKVVEEEFIGWELFPQRELITFDGISLKELIQVFKEDKQTCLVLLAENGMGKTTLCHRLVYAWARQETWIRHFNAVIYIPLSRFNELYTQSPDTNVIDFLLDEIFSDNPIFKHGEKENIRNIIENILETQNVLFLLDGYSEISSNNWLNPSLKILMNRHKIIITALPIHKEHIKNQLPQHATVIWADILGFSDKSIKNYVQIYFLDQSQRTLTEKGKNLLKTLNDYPVLRKLAQMPVNLNLFCNLYKNGELQRETFTLTEIYYQMVNWLLVIFLKNQKMPYDFIQEGGKPTDYDRNCHMIEEVLSSIAWEKLSSNAFYFSRGQLEVAVRRKLPYDTLIGNSVTLLEKAGFLKKSFGKQPQYSFLHSGFKEYFAANYIVKFLVNFYLSPTDKNTLKLVEEFWHMFHVGNLEGPLKWAPRFASVWWFAVGLIYNNKSLNDLQRKHLLNRFFQALDDNPKDILKEYSLGLKARFLEETYLAPFLIYSNTWIKEIEKTIITGVETLKWQPDKLVFNKMFNFLSFTRRVLEYSQLLNELLHLLNQDINESQGKLIIKIIEFLAFLGIPKATEVLLKQLQDDRLWVRIQAIKSLGFIAQGNTFLPIEFLEALKNLEHRLSFINKTNNDEVELPSKEVVLNALSQLLAKNDDWQIPLINTGFYRSLTTELQELETKPSSFPFQTNVESFIKDKLISTQIQIEKQKKDLHRIQTVQEIKKNIKENLIPSSTITATLISALTNSSTEIKKAIIKALCFNNQDEQDPELVASIIFALLSLLHDRVFDVRRETLITLSSFTPKGKALSENLAGELIQSLKDPSAEIRIRAMQVLNTSARNNSLMPEYVTEHIIQALSDPDETVRILAAETLGQLAKFENFMPDKAITSLIEAFKTNDVSLKRTIMKAIGYYIPQLSPIMGEKLTKTFESAMKEEDRRLWQLTMDALTDDLMNQKILPDSLIDSIISNLKYDSSWVKIHAAEALGKIVNSGFKLPYNVIMILKENLHDDDPEVSRVSAITLAKMIQINKDALLALIENLFDNPFHVRFSCIEALSYVAEDKNLPQETIKSLIVKLNDSESPIRTVAVNILGTLLNNINDSKLVFDELVKALNDNDIGVRYSAAHSLGIVALSGREDVLIALINNLNDKNVAVQYSIIQTLNKISLPNIFSLLNQVPVDLVAKYFIDRISSQGNALCLNNKKISFWENTTYYVIDLDQFCDNRKVVDSFLWSFNYFLSIKTDYKFMQVPQEPHINISSQFFSKKYRFIDSLRKSANYLPPSHMQSFR